MRGPSYLLQINEAFCYEVIEVIIFVYIFSQATFKGQDYLKTKQKIQISPVLLTNYSSAANPTSTLSVFTFAVSSFCFKNSIGLTTLSLCFTCK